MHNMVIATLYFALLDSTPLPWCQRIKRRKQEMETHEYGSSTVETREWAKPVCAVVRPTEAFLAFRAIMSGKC